MLVFNSMFPSYIKFIFIEYKYNNNLLTVGQAFIASFVLCNYRIPQLRNDQKYGVAWCEAFLVDDVFFRTVAYSQVRRKYFPYSGSPGILLGITS